MRKERRKKKIGWDKFFARVAFSSQSRSELGIELCESCAQPIDIDLHSLVGLLQGTLGRAEVAVSEEGARVIQLFLSVELAHDARYQLRQRERRCAETLEQEVVVGWKTTTKQSHPNDSRRSERRPARQQNESQRRGSDGHVSASVRSVSVSVH